MKGPPTFLWVLVGLLALSAALISLGKTEARTDPSVSSYAPSGSRAFVELLTRSGYTVAVDDRSTPRPTPSDLVVAFVVTNESIFGDSESHAAPGFIRSVGQFVSDGGRALILPVDDDFREASVSATEDGPVRVTSAKGRVAQILTGSASPPPALLGANTASSLDLWQDADDGRVELTKKGRGYMAVAYDGLLATNRFIDRADNATVLMSTVRTLMPKGGRVVFAQGGIGYSQDTGLIGAMGAWASGAWYQLVFLFLVIVYTLGKRFGLAEDPPRKQRGGRELVDAVSNLIARSRSTPSVLEAAVESADFAIRSTVKLPKGASAAERERLLPPTLLAAIERAQVLANEQVVAPDVALDVVRRLETELAHFTGQNLAAPASASQPAAQSGISGE